MTAVGLAGGRYDVVVDGGFRSVWTLSVSGTQISGSSTWDCCPGPRVDGLSGQISANQVTIVRDCNGQGQTNCRQTYVGSISNGSVSGTWSGTFEHGGASWTMTLAK